MASAAIQTHLDATPAAAAPHRSRCRDLLDHALGRLLEDQAGRRPEDRGRHVGPLVIVAPGPAAASRCLDAFLARRAAGGAAATPLARPALWDGESLGRALVAADRPSRLIEMCAGRPLVVVDDLERLRGRDCQNHFANLLDEAAGLGTVFCLSIERPPGAAKNLEPRLASRLCAGLVVPITQPPGAAFPGEARDPGRPGDLSLRRVFRVVARHHELDVEDLVGPSRRRAVASARSLAMYLARVLTPKSLYAIGAACGGRDHTTVMHGVRVVERQLARDTAFTADVARLIADLQGMPPTRRASRGRGRRAGVDPVSNAAAKPRGSRSDIGRDDH